MPRTIAYRAGGFTNCGISYTKFSQEELAEMKDRVMTENEATTKNIAVHVNTTLNMRAFVAMETVNTVQISVDWMIHVRNGRKTKNE